jgi:hypothetical protein
MRDYSLCQYCRAAPGAVVPSATIEDRIVFGQGLCRDCMRITWTLNDRAEWVPYLPPSIRPVR